MGKISNYHRFYASLNRLPGGNTEDMKETLVSSFTDGRTTSLKEMTQKEYNAMCASLEERTGWKEQLKKKRSLCLKLMQKAGIDTTDWQRINDFCRNPKIAGKEFAQLGVKDLDARQGSGGSDRVAAYQTRSNLYRRAFGGYGSSIN